MESTQALVTKVLAAAKDSGYVQKASDHAQGYKYADDEAITTKFRDAMIAQGVLVFPEGMEYADIQTFPDPEGKKAPNVLVSIKGHLAVTDGIASLKVASLGQGIDRGDKAIYKAMTGFKKYGYRHLVMMATGDDPEVAREDEKPAPTAAAKRSTAGLAGAESSNNAPATDPEATQKQKNKIFARAKEVGLSDENLAKLRERVTDKRSSSQFRNSDIDKMLSAMDDTVLLAEIVSGGEAVPA